MHSSVFSRFKFSQSHDSVSSLRDPIFSEEGILFIGYIKYIILNHIFVHDSLTITVHKKHFFNTFCKLRSVRFRNHGKCRVKHFSVLYVTIVAGSNIRSHYIVLPVLKVSYLIIQHSRYG